MTTGLVVVKAFDADGQGGYADVIRGIDWIVQNKDVYGIRVLNMSLSAPPRSHYWDDPLNQAVMAAWEAGIVVVASAGNGGPDPMTIGVPGNVPYIITVGAMSDNFTPGDGSDDRAAVAPDATAAGDQPGGSVMPTTTLDPVAEELAALRDSGKPVISYSENLSTAAYLMAAQADEVYVHPAGAVSISGLGGYRSYVREMLEKLKVSIHKNGKYKKVFERNLTGG